MRKQTLVKFSTHHHYAPMVGQVYGSTEMGLASFRSPYTRDEFKAANSLGVQPKTRDFKIEIRHQTENRLCASGEVGAIFTLSPMRIKNYWHTRHQTPMQWIDMGDLGYLDDEGNLFLTGRTKDIIILR